MTSTAEDILKNKTYTPEEYLALEEELNQKFEYVDGQVYDMTGGSVNHGLIGKNITTTLDIATHDIPCTIFNSDVKLYIESVGNYFYPDAMMLCDDHGIIEENHVQNPQMIIEVLSPSTEDYDHGKKFSFYRLIDTLQTYIMVYQDKPLVEVYQRNPDSSWLMKEYAGLDQVITINDQLALSLSDMYRKVSFPASEAPR